MVPLITIEMPVAIAGITILTLCNNKKKTLKKYKKSESAKCFFYFLSRIKIIGWVG